MDRLLATRADFLLGRWLNAAKSWGTTPAEKDLYEKNARNLLTLWGDKDSKLSEYANRQWSGLLNGYYKPRWEQFFAYAGGQLAKKQEVDQKAFNEQIKNWEWAWVNRHELYPAKTSGDAVTVAQEMYRKYHPAIKNSYRDE
jgi:alpha-N-acetylglucosaminidase